MLAVEGLEVGYGKVIVVWDVSFRVEDGEIVTIIGPNGAGKTTILRAVAGLLRPRSGRIAFRGREIGGLAAPAIATLGLALVPEGRELFPHMTVYENLQLGGRRAGRRVDARLQRVYTLFPRLAERARQLAATLSGGEQQMLAIGRALMSEPHLLLLDEPSTGLAPLGAERAPRPRGLRPRLCPRARPCRPRWRGRDPRERPPGAGRLPRPADARMKVGESLLEAHTVATAAKPPTTTNSTRWRMSLSRRDSRSGSATLHGSSEAERGSERPIVGPDAFLRSLPEIALEQRHVAAVGGGRPR